MDVKRVFECSKYLLYAVAIIKNNFRPLLILAAISLLLFVPSPTERASSLLVLISFFLLIIFYPLCYGQYIEITLHNRELSYHELFHIHWLNFFIVSIILGIPGLFVFISLSDADMNTQKYLRSIVMLTIDIIAIYIIPIVFIIKKRIQSITLGFKCILGNLGYSMPLILLTLMSSGINIVVNYQLENDSYGFVNILYFLSTLFIIYIDFIVFIAATLILKNKIFKSSGMVTDQTSVFDHDLDHD